MAQRRKSQRREALLARGVRRGPSEAMRQGMDYFALGPNTGAALARLAAFEPRTLACMHGSSFSGNGRALLGELARTLQPAPR